MTDLFQLLISHKLFFLDLTLEHLGISLFSVILASILGLGIGVTISEYRHISGITLAGVNFIYTIPSISMLGFLIPFTGIGNLTAVIALTIYALLPMVRNTYTGITHIDPLIIEAAEGMGSTPIQVLLKIKLPLAMPVILSGIKNMIVMTVALTGIASFIGAGGLGVAIYRGITTNNQTMTVAGSLLIAFIALGLDGLFSLVERVIKRRRVNQVVTTKRRFRQSYLVIAVLLIAFLIGAGNIHHGKAQVIEIATKPMTEQYIIGNILKYLIENESDLKVNLTTGVGGGTANIQPGMIKGDFDIYPEYTGTAWNTVLKHENVYDEEMFDQLADEYQKNFQFKWLGAYGFENSYCLVVRKEIADEYELQTISDLAKIAENLTIGANYDFYERPDGYEGLTEAYEMRFKKKADMDIGLKYQALANDQVDCIVGFTTDGQLADVDAVILKDDRKYYSSYQCVNVVRNEVLETHPELKIILNKVDGLITNEEMYQLNHLVEKQKIDPKQVAKKYLIEKGVLQQEEG